MAMVYQFRNGPPVAGLDPQRVGESLSRIEKAKGALNAPDVVEAARPETSPLHKAFDWDDSVAAQKWRLEQAGNLIRCVVVTHIEDKSPQRDVRAFVSIPVDNSGGKREYHNIVSVMSDKEKRDKLLKLAYAELCSWRDRYENLSEFSELFDIIEDLGEVADLEPARKAG